MNQWTVFVLYKIGKQKYHTVGTVVPKSNRNIETERQPIPLTDINDRSLSSLGTGTSIKGGGDFMGPNLPSYWNDAVM